MKVNGNDVRNTLASVNAPKKTLKQWVVSMSDQIRNALPANITPERMQRIALTALSRNQELADSTPESFMGALLTAAQLGLECNTPLGQAYLIPYRNKGVLETQFQLGYQGLIDLCYRTGQYKRIVARVVYEGDEFDFVYGSDEKLVHRPMGKSQKPVAVYGFYELTNGASAFEVLSWEEVMAHAKRYSRAVQKGWTSPWSTDPESMAKKTVLKRVLKYAPKTVENAKILAEAVSNDSAVIQTNFDGGGISLTKQFDFGVSDSDSAEIEAEPNVDTPSGDDLF